MSIEYMLFRVLMLSPDLKLLRQQELGISKNTYDFLQLDNSLGLKINLELKLILKTVEEMKLKTELTALNLEIIRKLVNFELNQECKVNEMISKLHLTHIYVEDLKNVLTKL